MGCGCYGVSRKDESKDKQMTRNTKNYIHMKRNIQELDGKYKHLHKICGYDVYIPTAFYNPISFLSKNCPVWIKINEEGDCEVLTLSKDNREENIKEMENFIQNNL